MGYKEKKWEVINEEDGGNLFKFTVFVDTAHKLPRDLFGIEFEIALELNHGHLRYAPDEGYKVFSEKLLNKLVNEKDFLGQTESNIKKYGDRLINISKKISKLKYQNLSSEEIQSYINDWLLEYQYLTDWGMVLVYIDMGIELLTKEAITAIEDSMENKFMDPVAIFSVLSTPIFETTIFREERDLLKIASIIKNQKELQKNYKKFEKYIIKHRKKYIWAYYAYKGPVMTVNSLLDRLINIFKDGQIDEKIKKQKKYLNDLDKNQKEIYKKLKLTQKANKLIIIAQSAMKIKAERKDYMYQSFYLIEGLLKEITKRGEISWSQLHHLLPWEIKEFLNGNINKAELNNRYDHCVYFTGGKLRLGDDVREYAKMLNVEVGEKREVLGQCACVGKVKGTIKIIDKEEDMHKMKPGDVLVSIATTPEVVPAMKKAAAIVTDIGGITCHAAIVSRELGIPCIIGTKFATKVFKDGDQVEVNADKGIVKKLNNK